jgi:alpha-beta hydrolase superfamily lysophospholipase
MHLTLKLITILLVLFCFHTTFAVDRICSAHSVHKNFTTSTNDGISLFGQSWEPADSIIGVICVFHGHGEHTGRYEQFASAMNDSGFAVTGFDLRGHGKSGGLRGHIPSYDQLMDDCSLILSETMKHYQGKPVFLLGNSMGGNIVVNYALRRKPQISGVIALAPQLRNAMTIPAWKVFAGRLFFDIWPTFGAGDGINRNYLSRSPEVVSSIKNDSLCHDRVTAHYFCINDAGEWALSHASDLKIETLIMHGDSDKVTSAEASRTFAEKSNHCTLKSLPGFYHQLYEEPGKEELFNYMVGWMRKRL